MAEYISREEALNLIEYNDRVCHYADERYENVVYATAQTICKVVAEIPAADVQPVYYAENVQNEVLNYLFNKEREAESMPYSDVRQERITTLREVIRYVEGIGDTNG